MTSSPSNRHEEKQFACHEMMTSKLLPYKNEYAKRRFLNGITRVPHNTEEENIELDCLLYNKTYIGE